MKRLFSGGALAAIAMLLLVGCSPFSGANSDSGGFTATDMNMGNAPDMAPSEAAPNGESADRAVITTGQVTLTVDDPILTADRAAAIVLGAGGRIDSRTEHPGSDTQSARAFLVLRIPADRLDAVLTDLRELGEVNAVSINISDVTMQSQDLDARITALSASVDRLLDLLAEATTTADLVAIESELTTRQAELDSLTSQRDALDDQIGYSTISLELLSAGIIAPPGPDDFWGGVVTGWHALIAFLSGLVIAVGVMLPWLGVLAVLAGIIVFIVWAARRRSRHAGADRGPTDHPPTVAQPAAPAGPAMDDPEAPTSTSRVG